MHVSIYTDRYAVDLGFSEKPFNGFFIKFIYVRR